jgi:hypothetical protein
MPCNYSWPWPKIDVDIVGCWVEPRGDFYTLLPILSVSPPPPLFLSLQLSLVCLCSSTLHSVQRVMLVPRFGLHPDGMKWCRGCRSNRCFPIRAFALSKISLPLSFCFSFILSPFLLLRSRFLSFLCVENALISRLFLWKFVGTFHDM